MGAFAKGSTAAEKGTQPGDKTAGLNAVAALLDRNGIDPADVGKVQRISLRETMSKDLASVTLSPAWDQEPQWPVVQPVTPAVIRYGNRPKPLSDGFHRTVLFPDPQIGFWRNLDTGELIAMHDDEAIAVALNIARAVRPDRIVHLGDFLDLAEFSSKFAVHPEFCYTTQEALYRGHNLIAECRAILGPREEEAEEDDLLLIAGNHDDRLGLAILQNAKAALRLKRADAPPDAWPAMSIPNYLALDVLDCEYVSGYPAGSVRLADGGKSQTPLYAVHERGLDVAKVAKTQRQSYVQGHAHRVAMHSETYELDDDAIDVEAWSLGSLCRRDGFVPSVKGSPDDRGTPVKRIESWQQAVGVLTVAPDGTWNMEAVRIRDGKAFYGGKVYTA
jgi:hypothetical protein